MQKVFIDDMIMTTDMPTSAGSKMLENFTSLFEADVVTRLKEKGYTIEKKANVGEFSIDLIGETSYFGITNHDGVLESSIAEIVNSGEVAGGIALDVNGSVRRIAAQEGFFSIKPTYGIVSRYGTVPVACSGETVSVVSTSLDSCKEILDAISGYDPKDGTSIPTEYVESEKKNVTKKNRVAVFNTLCKKADEEIVANIKGVCETLQQQKIEVDYIENDVIACANTAWNILMSAELCNNVSRYDGIKFGYRTNEYSSVDDIYMKSRTEAFGDLLKTAILYGSDSLSTENYDVLYDKALRMRRLIVDAMNELFEQYDMVIMPAASKNEYTMKDVQDNKYISFSENYFTAPASITGMPVVVAAGVQMVGKLYSEELLLEYAKMFDKEAR